MNWYVSEKVKENFKNRLNQVKILIKESGIEYIEVGVFGSYARNEYNATSDIDICIIAKQHPERIASGMLRLKADELKVDIIYSTPEYFYNNNSLFAKNLRRDYRRINLDE